MHIMIILELCFFSLHQWEIKIHLLWGECFNIPHWPRSHLTTRRLQHIEKLSKTYSGNPHLDQTKLNGLLLLTIHGVLAKLESWHLGVVIYNQIVTWTAFAILAMFLKTDTKTFSCPGRLSGNSLDLKSVTYWQENSGGPLQAPCTVRTFQHSWHLWACLELFGNL